LDEGRVEGEAGEVRADGEEAELTELAEQSGDDDGANGDESEDDKRRDRLGGLAADEGCRGKQTGEVGETSGQQKTASTATGERGGIVTAHAGPTREAKGADEAKQRWWDMSEPAVLGCWDAASRGCLRPSSGKLSGWRCGRAVWRGVWLGVAVAGNFFGASLARARMRVGRLEKG